MTENFNPPAFYSPFWLPGGHLQTIAPRFFRQPEVRYRRELRADSTGQTQVGYDFVDGKEDAPLLVLFHGLEGGSGSHYAHWLMHAVARAGWHGVVAHFRSCGGVRNTAPVFYHSGDSAEIAFMLGCLKKEYPRIFAVGVSLGGNALAKYLGETRRADCLAAAVVSAPVDLPQAGVALDTPFCRKTYVPYFLKSLIPKALENTQDTALKARLRQCRSLHEFDDLFTAPLHGFASADEYYRLSSARPLLKNIAVPTLLLNAQNDPFFPAPYLPHRQEVSPAVTLLQPAAGGHVGFYCAHRPEPLMWLPQTLLDFFRTAENAVQAA